MFIPTNFPAYLRYFSLALGGAPCRPAAATAVARRKLLRRLKLKPTQLTICVTPQIVTRRWDTSENTVNSFALTQTSHPGQRAQQLALVGSSRAGVNCAVCKRSGGGVS